VGVVAAWRGGRRGVDRDLSRPLSPQGGRDDLTDRRHKKTRLESRVFSNNQVSSD